MEKADLVLPSSVVRVSCEAGRFRTVQAQASLNDRGPAPPIFQFQRREPKTKLSSNVEHLLEHQNAEGFRGNAEVSESSAFEKDVNR